MENIQLNNTDNMTPEQELAELNAFEEKIKARKAALAEQQKNKNAELVNECDRQIQEHLNAIDELRKRRQSLLPAVTSQSRQSTFSNQSGSEKCKPDPFDVPPTWRYVLQEIEKQPADVSIAELQDAVDTNHPQWKNNRFNPRISVFVQSGYNALRDKKWIEQVRVGIFRKIKPNTLEEKIRVVLSLADLQRGGLSIDLIHSGVSSKYGQVTIETIKTTIDSMLRKKSLAKQTVLGEERYMIC